MGGFGPRSITAGPLQVLLVTGELSLYRERRRRIWSVVPMSVLVAGARCYLRRIRVPAAAGMLAEMSGQNTGCPVPDALAAARG